MSKDHASPYGSAVSVNNLQMSIDKSREEILWKYWTDKHHLTRVDLGDALPGSTINESIM